MDKNENASSVAVVILNWNGQKYLEKFLPAVMKTAYPNYFVVVADNGSTDDSVLFLKTSYPSVKIIELNKNYGFAEGYNRALAEVEANYFILLNSDIEVTPNWIQPVTDLMATHPQIAACQPKIRSLKQRTHFEYAGAAGGWIDTLGYPFCRGRIFDFCEEDTGQYDASGPVFWATGACLFLRSEVFRKMNGFDPYFFAHQEEIDLCWRIQNAGYEVWVQPQSIVYHLGGGSLKSGSERKVFLNYRNNLILLAKNLDGITKYKVLLTRMVLDGISAFRFILLGKPGLFITVLKAHFGFYKWIMHNKIPEKTKPQPLKMLSGVYNGSIVYSYFIKRKRIFSKIVQNKR